MTRARSRPTRTATRHLEIRSSVNFVVTVDGKQLNNFVSTLLIYGSPVASLLAMDAPKIILKGGLFDHLPRPGVTSFPQNQPEWLDIKA